MVLLAERRKLALSAAGRLTACWACMPGIPGGTCIAAWPGDALVWRMGIAPVAAARAVPLSYLEVPQSEPLR